MEETQPINPQPSRIDRLKVTWHALDKKKWAKISGVVVTIGVLVVAGLRTGARWHPIHK